MFKFFFLISMSLIEEKEANKEFNYKLFSILVRNSDNSKT